MWSVDLWGSLRSFQGDPCNRNYSKNPMMSFTFFDMLTFALLVQKQWWVNLLTP